MKQTIKIDGRCWCPQCGHYYDYKEMADEKTCQECVHQTREFQKVDFKRLLESMPDEDIDEVISELEGFEKDCLRIDMREEILEWQLEEDETTEDLIERIIKLI